MDTAKKAQDFDLRFFLHDLVTLSQNDKYVPADFARLRPRPRAETSKYGIVDLCFGGRSTFPTAQNRKEQRKIISESEFSAYGRKNVFTVFWRIA